MAEEINGGPSTNFWIVGGAALVWNLIGLIFYYQEVTLTPEQLESVTEAQRAFMLDKPAWATSSFAIAVTTGVLGSLLILGKNIYCGKICPFQYVERGLNKISGINLAVRPGVQKSARTVVGLMTWTALMLIFLSSHPTLGSYEPFSLIFSLTGTGVHWYILPLSLIGSFFVLNFWCRLFCPVGHVLNKTVRVRKRMLGGSKKGAAKPIADEVQPAEPEDKGDLWRKES